MYNFSASAQFVQNIGPALAPARHEDLIPRLPLAEGELPSAGRGER